MSNLRADEKCAERHRGLKVEIKYVVGELLAKVEFGVPMDIVRISLQISRAVIKCHLGVVSYFCDTVNAE